MYNVDPASDGPSKNISALDPVEPYRTYFTLPDTGSDDEVPHDPVNSANGDGFHRLRAFYPNSLKAVEAELRRLFHPFRISVAIGRCQYSPSSTWRDEWSMLHQSNDSYSRFAVRAHIFARSSSGSAGRYLGFVCLRPEEAVKFEPDGRFSYVIDAELGPPGHMLRPRYHILTTTTSSVRLGIMPFRSAVFSCCSREEERNSTCMQIAVSQGLHLMMGRFGCRPVSQIEFETLLWKLSRAAQRPALSEIGARGATPSEALDVLLGPECNAGGFLISRKPSRGGKLLNKNKWAVLRLITDSLACGLPVIAIIDAHAIAAAEPGHTAATGDGNGDRTAEKLKKKATARANKEPHAVLIVGMRLLHCRSEMDALEWPWENREDRAELPGRVILHDPVVQGPYFEWCISDFLKAAESPYGDHPDGDRFTGIHLLVLGPAKMRMGLDQARFFAEGEVHLALLNTASHPLHRSLLEYSRRAGCTTLPGAHQWRIVCRLGNLDELESRYDRHSNGAIHRAAKDRKLRRDARYYWAAEVHLPEAPSHARESPDGPLPAAVFIWDTTRNARTAMVETDLLLGWTQGRGSRGAGKLKEIT